MDYKIRLISKEDKQEIFRMMEEFYSSDAVFTNGSARIFENDIDTCTGGSPYLEGFVIEKDGDILGYSMIAKSFSTEFGKSCIWIEDLYIKAEFRGLGLGGAMLEFITNRYTDCIFRLEVEPENENAIKLYKKLGFSALPYMEMKK